MNDTMIYVVLGTPNSGRRALIADLAQSMEGEAVQVWVSSREPITEHATVLERMPGVSYMTHTVQDAKWQCALPTEPTVIFWMLESQSSIVDQLEWLANWRRVHGVEITRVLTVVNCQLACKQPSVKEWFDACVHFSDVVVLNRRENLEPRLLQTFVEPYKKECYPCLWVNMKNGKVPNPPEVLLPEPRRMSLVFDDIDAVDTLEVEILDASWDEPMDLVVKPDPYFERTETGVRVKRISQQVIFDILENS